MATVYDLIAKIGWDTNARELEHTIDLTRQQGKMVDELRMKGARLEQQIVKTNDPKKLKKYNDELQETRKRADAITQAQKNQANVVEGLNKRQKELQQLLRANNDPKVVQGLLRSLHQVENQLHVINAQATTLPNKLGGLGKSLMQGIGGGIIGGGIVGAVALASNAISGFFSDSIAEAAEAEQGLLRFKQTLDNLGKGDLFDGLVADADRLAKTYKNLFDNDDILAGQAKFIEGTKVSKDQLKQLIPVAIELAAKLGTDVVTASEMLTNTIIGRTSPELKRLGLNMKGVGTETGRVNEITGDFANLLTGSVETALQTAQGSTKQLRQELANLEEDLGSKLLPLQKRLTKFKISLLDAFNYALETDTEKQLRQIDLVAEAYAKKLAPQYKNQKKLSQETINEGILREEKRVLAIQETLEKINKLSDFKKQFQTDNVNKLNNELVIAQGKLKALKGLIIGVDKASKESINPNAGADEETAKTKATGETAEQRIARLKKEQEDSDRIIKDARLSLMEQEAREIAIREQKYEDDKKKLRNVSAEERLIFEEALQQDIADIHDKYNQKELQRLDKQLDDINRKVEENMRKAIKDGQEKDEKQKELQDSNLTAMQAYAKQQSDIAKESYDEQAGYQMQLYENAKDLISVGQDYLNQEINRTSKLIALQEDRVESARKSSTASVKIEEDRLNELLAKRRKYEQAQRVIDAAVIVANQAVAISGAVRTIATSGNPIIIAANVAAIAAGIIASTLAVRSAFSDDGFYDGGYTGDGNPRETSTAQGRRGYKYHKGEFVMNHELTNQHRDMFEGIHKGELMVKQMGDGYYLAPSLDVDSAVSDSTNARINFDVSSMVSELSEIKGFLKHLNLNVNNNFDQDGFGQAVGGQLNAITIKNLLRK
jgi:hypothetical protein